jgi:hypothetical protein
MAHASHATLKALLVDPVAAEARIVSLTLQDGELVLAEVYRLLGCDIVERAPLNDQHLIWTDEEGWECATVANDLAPILARFTCHRCIFEPEFETLSGDTPVGFFIQQRLKGTTPRIDRTRPALVSRLD